MKSSFILALIIFFGLYSYSQTVIFNEDFELPSSADSVSSTGSPTWSISTTLSAQGQRSDSSRLVNPNDSSVLTTLSFSTIGNSYVTLEFEHICKIEFFDEAYIQVSNDNGATWVKLTAGQYQGTSNFSVQGNKFTSGSYVDWLPAQSNAIPTNSWWKHEKFDISTLVANSPNVKIRFVLNDDNSTGGVGNYGWLVDAIKVTGSPSELISPTISLISIPNDTIFGIDPVNIKAYISDASGIDTAYLIYSVNGSIQDTVGMNMILTDTFSGYIPFQGFGRSICWKIVAIDNSPAANFAVNPSSGCDSYFHKHNLASTATVGTGTSSVPYYIFYGSYQDTRMQQLYTASEIMAGGAISGGNITSLALNIATASSSVFNGFTIKIKQTAATTLSAFETTGFTTVYSANYSPSATGWQTFNFTTPFAWDGVSNILVNFCFDNSSTATSAYYYYTSTTGKAFYAYNSSTSGVNGCDLTTGYTSSYRANIKFNIAGAPALATDGGFGIMTSPSGTVYSGQNTDVKIKIKNFGTDTLHSLAINWKVDGVSQTPVTWTGNLLKDSLSPVINLGSMNFTTGNHTIEFFTSLPNGLSDMNWANDNYSYSFYACSSSFSGTYTLGGTNPDFTSFNNVISSINQCGLTGPVVINVAPGVYRERVIIPPILGISATNTLTFQSTLGDSSLVILEDSATNVNNNYVVSFNQAKYITFKKITIKALGTDYSTVFSFNGPCDNIHLISNNIQGVEMNSINDTYRRLVVFAQNLAYDSITFVGNRFHHGSSGIQFYSTTFGTNFKFLNNYFYNQGERPFSIDGLSAFEFAYNVAISDSSKTVNRGIFTQHLIGQWTFHHNVFKNMMGPRVWEGWIYTGEDVGKEALVYNNYFYGGNTSVYVFDFGGGGTNVKFLNNTFVGNSTTRCVNFNNYYGTGANFTFSNNVVVSTLSAMHLTAVPVNYHADSNIFWTTANNKFSTGSGPTHYTTLAAFRAATGQDAHSIFANPNMAGLHDPHITNFSLKGTASPYSFINTDIDGQARNPQTPDAGCDELIYGPNDAGVKAMASQVFCPGTNNVEVKLGNFGSGDIDSVKVFWSINNLAQTTLNYTTTIPYNSTITVNLGSFNFQNHVSYDLKFWTSAPNGASDDFAGNDTLTITGFRTSFTGTYTIGDATSDFMTPVEAINSINQFGVCGATIFNVKPGTYNGRLLIEEIPGISSTNNFTIQSLNNDTSAVITDSATSTANNYIVKLSGAKYVSINNLSLKPKNTVTYNNCLVIDGGSRYNTITANLFEGKTNGTTTDLALLRCEDPTSKLNNIVGNRFFKGSHSIYMKGTSAAARLDSLYIARNIVQDFQVNGIYVGYANEPIIDSNIIISSISNASSTKSGIYLTYCYNRFMVTKNTIQISGTNYPVGFFTSTTLSTAYSRGIFANNFISLTGGTTNSYGLRIYPGTNLDVVYNSIYVNGSSTSDTRGINVAPGSSNVKVINNNVVCNYFPTLYEGATVMYSDYNNFYSQLNQYAYRPASTNLIYSSLAALKAVTHMDSNSISYNPLFTSITDLHTNMGMLNGTAKIYPGITNDIDGETRNLTTPDIGADEFLPMANDISPILLAGPGNGCGYTNAEIITLRIKNVGSAVVNGGFSASIKINNGTVITENVTSTIQPSDYVDYSFNTTINQNIVSITHDSTFIIKAWTSYNLDGADYNDTLNTSLISGYLPSSPTALDTTIFYGTTASLTATGSNLLAWFDQSSSTIPVFVGANFNTPALYDTTIYQVGIKSSQGIGCVSPTIQQTVNVINYPSNDAGVTSILDPISDIPSGVKHSLKIRLKNFGLNNLTSSSIYYSMNGKVAPVINWTGSINFNNHLDIEVDSINPKGGIITLKVWTTLPNNITDSFPNNDTSIFVFKACMNGTYTVGNTIGKIYDFESLTQAKNALVAAGLCGPVTFSLDTGIYNEQVSFPEIATVTQTNTVTIEGTSTDSTQAVLRYTPASSTDNYVLRLDGADYYTIKKITIENKSTSNGYALVITNNANNNFIGSNNIIATGTSGSSTAGIYSGTTSENFTTIINNSITGGYHGIYWYGPSTSSWEKGIVISGNLIKGFYYYGLNASYQDSTYIEANKITNAANSATQYGLNAQYFNNFYKISKNIITLSGTSTNYGLRDYYGNYYSYNANPTGSGIVSNNMVTTLTGTSSYGIYSYYSNGSRYYYNTSVIETGSQAAFYHYNTISNLGGIGFKNNIFVTKGTGYAAYLATNNSIFENDYNNYYTNGPTLVYWGSTSYASLQLFQAASLRDFHSTNLLPSFYPNNDLHLLTPALMAKGVAISAVGDDIDGEARPSIPTIGADEYIPRAIDAGIFTILTPGNIAYEYDTIAPKVVLCNYGTDTLTSIPIVYTVNTGQTVNYTYNVVVPGGECDTIYLPTYVSPLGNVNICTETNLSNDSAFFNNGVCKSYLAKPYKDVKLSSALKLDEGCDLTTDTLRIRIANMGIVQVNGGLTAYYKVNNGSTVSQAVTNLINVNDSILFEFSTPINLAVTTNDSIYDIVSWLDYVGDNISDNDSISTTTKSFHTPNPPTTTQLVQIPYATTATLTAVSTDSVLWYDSQFGGNKLHEGSSYTTGINYADDSVFVEARGGGAGLLVDVGTGTTSNGSSASPTPYKNYFWGSKEQYMLTAQELTALGAAFGPVTSLSFNVQAVNACPSLDGFTIKIAHTNQTDLTTTFVTGNFTTVYTSTSYQPVTGWNTHQFQTPFNWDGTSNIVIEICSNNSSWVTSGNASVYNTITSNYFTTYSQGDNATVCSNTTGTRTYTRPNMRIDLAPTGCPSQRVPVAIDVLNIPAYDLGIFNNVSPISSVYMGSQELVKVKIKNYGDSTVNAASVTYQIDNQTPVVEIINNINLSSQDTMEYVFSAAANLNTPGMTYNFKAWTTLANDITTINDTIQWSVTNQIPSYCVSTALYTSYYDIANVTFAGLNNTSPTPYSALYTDYSSVATGNIAPGNTYPISVDIQTTTTSSTPGYCKVFIDFDRNGLFDAATETAFESAFTAGGQVITGTVLVPSIANIGLSKMRVVAVYNGNSSTVLPCGTYSYGETEDYTMIISPLIPYDISVENLLSPDDIVIGNTTHPVKALLKNVGSDTIYANMVMVKYSIDNIEVDSMLLTTTLAPADTISITFNNAPIQKGYNSVCVFTNLVADTNVFNNEKCKVVFGESNENVPYTNNFDGNNYWYSNSVWQNGAPAGTVINTTHSAPNAWKTMLSGNYPNSTYSYLESPNFFFNQVPGQDRLILKFWHTMDCETLNDGGRIQYSTDGGQNWAGLGYITDPQSTNWYNSNNGGTHQWSGSIPWQQAEYKLDSMTLSTTYQIQFRFLFTSNASTNNYDGWAIDDIELIYPQQPQDAGVVSIISPSDSVAKGSSYNVKVAVKNFGTQNIFSTTVKYNTGSSTITEVFTPIVPIAPNQVDTFTFNQPFVGPTANFTLCSWTALAADAYYFNDSTCKQITATNAPWDVAIGQIITPGDTTKASHNTVVSAYLKNLGTNTITSIPLKFMVNNIVWAQETANISIAPEDSVPYSFTTTYSNVLGNYSLCIIADLSNDGDTTNDFRCRQVFGKNDVGMENFVESNFLLKQNIPNPAKANTRFEFETPVGGKLNFNIVNTLGQQVISKEISAIQGLNSIDIDLSWLSQGIYYYSIEMEGHKLTRKLIVSD